jgi:hypothetical protein
VVLTGLAIISPYIHPPKAQSFFIFDSKAQKSCLNKQYFKMAGEQIAESVWLSLVQHTLARNRHEKAPVAQNAWPTGNSHRTNGFVTQLRKHIQFGFNLIKAVTDGLQQPFFCSGWRYTACGSRNGRSSSAEIHRLRHTKMGRRTSKTYFTGDGEKIMTIRA